jgi:hypothetical protein
MKVRTISSLSEVKLTLIGASLLVVFIVGKMVGLESIAFGAAPFEFKIVAAMLPLAMVFGRYGIAGIGIGCPLAHLIAFGSVVNAGFAFFAAFGGSLASYLLYKRYRGPLGLVVGSITILAFWTFVFGGYFAYDSNLPLVSGFWQTFSSLWIGINFVGVAVALLIRQAIEH